MNSHVMKKIAGDILPEKKICLGCQADFPSTPEFFFVENKSRGKLRARCKSCMYTSRFDSRAKPENKKRQAAYDAKRNAMPERKLINALRNSEWFSKPENKLTRNAQVHGRYYSDTDFKLAKVLRSRIHSAIRNRSKSGSAVKLLGCTIEELRVYIEKQFVEGMTWENWSQFGWHLDHILPLSSFNLSDPDQLKKACHFTNLQPLWWRDNIIKGGA